MNEVSKFSFDEHERISRSTTDVIHVAMAIRDHEAKQDSEANLLRMIPPPQPRMHSDLHPHDYERMASILQLARTRSNSPKDMSREPSYISPGSSRASSILSGQDGRPSISKLHQQLAALRARKPPRPSPANPNDHFASGPSFMLSESQKRRVQSYTSGTDDPAALTRDQMLGIGQASQTNLKVSMRRAVFAKRSWQLGPSDDEAEAEEEPGGNRTSLTRREVMTHSAVCLGPRLSNSRSVKLMMQMGLLRSQSRKRENFGNKVVPVMTVERTSAGDFAARRTPTRSSLGSVTEDV